MKGTSQQAGLVMVVALIMLALVTLLASVSANIILSDLRVVQNVEAKSAVRGAALEAIQEAIGTDGFLPPYPTGQSPAPGATFRKDYDLSGDKRAVDVEVVLTYPKCLAFTLIPNSFFDYVNNEADRECQVRKQRYSSCGNALFEVEVTAIDSVTGAKVEIRQGITQLSTAQDIQKICPRDYGQGEG